LVYGRLEDLSFSFIKKKEEERRDSNEIRNDVVEVLPTSVVIVE